MAFNWRGGESILPKEAQGSCSTLVGSHSRLLCQQFTIIQRALGQSILNKSSPNEDETVRREIFAVVWDVKNFTEYSLQSVPSVGFMAIKKTQQQIFVLTFITSVLSLLRLFSGSAGKLCVSPNPASGVSINHMMSVPRVRNTKQLDGHIPDWLSFKHWCGCWWGSRLNYRSRRSFTVNYGRPCLYIRSPPRLDNDTLSRNERYRWTKEHFPLRVHQQLSLHALCLLMNCDLRTGAVRANFQKRRVRWVSTCSLGCNLPIGSGICVHIRPCWLDLNLAAWSLREPWDVQHSIFSNLFANMKPILILVAWRYSASVRPCLHGSEGRMKSERSAMFAFRYKCVLSGVE